MKKIFLLLILIFLFGIKDTYAFSSENYKNRDLCGNFEVAGFHTDGVIDTVSCHSTFEEAKTFMKNNGADDLAIMTKVNGVTKILDANVGLLDLSVNPTTLTYFYRTSDMNTFRYTYMDTGSLYGGVDGAIIETVYSSKGVWAAKVLTGNCLAWISQEAYEVVPITWIKSTSTYTVTDDYIRHNYVAKIQENYNGSAGSTIGPKPEMLSNGTYYSFDGHYFYKDLKTMIKDYRNNTRQNSVNKDKPYYNYYMYLSNHTRTSYSSVNIDEYIRGSLGITRDAYGNASSNNSSRLYGKGQFYYYAQEKYGVNAVLSLSLSRNETANGRSNLAINKNNGFGLNAVDSNPYQSANWYASFASSILGYASHWVTYGYADPNDWRYFGPQFGDKGLGMNVNYASDTYWSEKMAANYYSLDKAKGMQDYNFYQLGVVTKPVNAMSDASNSSKFVYTYPEAEDAVVIIGEKEGQVVDGDATWYKVVSDLNIDSNFNEITSGDYNWNGFVYIPASAVNKINKGKNGYISPNDVTEYIDKDYEYDLYDENNTLKPRVAKTTKNADYYYESSLQNKKGITVLKDKYVMVYAAAYKNNKPVSYLITSDYKYDQKDWVSADSIDFITSDYGHVEMLVSGNQYTWVNSTTIDSSSTLISGQYTNSYVPVLEQKTVDGHLWYKVPVNLTGTTNSYGWTLQSAPEVVITLSTFVVENTAPVINAVDKTVIQGIDFDKLAGVSATDKEDGDLSKKVTIQSTNLDINTVGTYQITYQVTDKENKTGIKTINITVTENKKPVITATDKVLTVNTEYDELESVSAIDEEDGEITKNVKVIENTVNIKTPGIYQITYQVTDKFNQAVTKTIKVEVVNNQLPEIIASNITTYLNKTFDELKNVVAIDKEDGVITENIEVIENTVNTSSVGTYKVIYKVTDSYGDSTTKEIIVAVIERKLEQKEGMFYFNYLKEDGNKLLLQGYQTIQGIDNNLNIEINYELIFKNIETEQEIIVDASRITKDIPKKVYSPDGKDYTYSWFNATIDISILPIGNYKMYLRASTDKIYSESLISNKTYNSQATKSNSGKKYSFISNNYDTSVSFIELRVREENLVEKDGSYIYNQYEKFTKFEFNDDNKLYIRGNSYSYGMNLSKTIAVKRTLVFENVNTYKTYSKNLGFITNGNYNVVLPVSDNLDKTKAWYDAKIDISDLPKGKYIMYIITKSNISDISEMKEKIGRSLDSVKTTINGKDYSFSINKEKGNRIELTIK